MLAQQQAQTNHNKVSRNSKVLNSCEQLSNNMQRWQKPTHNLLPHKMIVPTERLKECWVFWLESADNQLLVRNPKKWYNRRKFAMLLLILFVVVAPIKIRMPRELS